MEYTRPFKGVQGTGLANSKDIAFLPFQQHGSGRSHLASTFRTERRKMPILRAEPNIIRQICWMMAGVSRALTVSVSPALSERAFPGGSSAAH